jgi:hypothetical protein
MAKIAGEDSKMELMVETGQAESWQRTHLEFIGVPKALIILS